MLMEVMLGLLLITSAPLAFPEDRVFPGFVGEGWAHWGKGLPS